MADVVIETPPFILVKPKLTIGAAGSLVEFECNANEVDASPEQDSTDTETFCGVFTSYKPEKWTVTITALQSFGTEGLWNLLRPMANTIQPFSILPDAAKPVGEDNPEMTGTAYVQGFAFLAAPVGEASEFDLVLAVQGVPTFDVSPVGLQAEQSEPEPQPA